MESGDRQLRHHLFMSLKCIINCGYMNDMLCPRVQIHVVTTTETGWFKSVYISTEKDTGTQQLLIKPLMLDIMTLCGKRGTGVQWSLVLIIWDVFTPSSECFPPELLLYNPHHWASSGLGVDSRDKSRSYCEFPSSVDWRKTQNMVPLFPTAEDITQCDEVKRRKEWKMKGEGCYVFYEL